LFREFAESLMLFDFGSESSGVKAFYKSFGLLISLITNGNFNQLPWPLVG
jgi:hypothetical protein